MAARAASSKVTPLVETSTRAAADSKPTKVLDTNVLLTDPQAIFAFENADVVITSTVLGELGRKKGDPELGYSAREALRLLRDQLTTDRRSSAEPRDIGRNSTLRLVPNGVMTQELESKGFDPKKADVRIIGACLGLKGKGYDVTLVTNDVEMQLVASLVHVPTEEFVLSMPAEHAGDGWRTIESRDRNDVDNLHRRGLLDLDHPAFDHVGLHHNEGVVLQTAGDPKHSAIARRKGDTVRKIGDRQIYLDDSQRFMFKPRSVEQKIALDLALDPDVSVLALVGKAGTGKTILALAAALHMSISPDYTNVQHIGIYRAPIAVSQSMSLGFLPGTQEEKLAPWFQQISDQLIALQGKHGDQQGADDWLKRLKEQSKLSFGSIEHIRGRSIRNSILVIEESQNLEVHVLKSLLSRAGENTRIFLTGDPGQIDAPYLSPTSNGLTAVVEAFHGRDLFGHVIMKKGERSKLADLAADLL